MKLTVEQINFFQAFGYLVAPQVFDQEEMERIVEGFEWSIKNCGAGKEHGGSIRTMFGGPIEHTPEMCALLDHPGLLDLVGGLIGEDFNYCGGDGNYYTGDTGWHPDGNWGQLFAVKVAFYLDELTRDTGCLRVIPRSHCADHFVRKEKINPNHSMELFGVPPRNFPGNVALETNPGDVAVFNHDTYHAAFGGGETRRMFTMNCTRHGKMPEGIERNKRYHKMHGPGGYNVLTGAGMYFQTMLDTANNGRMLYLEQPAKIYDEIFPHLARGNVDRIIVMSQEVSMLQPALKNLGRKCDVNDVLGLHGKGWRCKKRFLHKVSAWHVPLHPRNPPLPAVPSRETVQRFAGRTRTVSFNPRGRDPVEPQNRWYFGTRTLYVQSKLGTGNSRTGRNCRDVASHQSSEMVSIRFPSDPEGRKSSDGKE